MIAFALALHTLGAVVWVGGMFFAHMALRPAMTQLDAERRLAVWRQVFPRFFAWVWASIIVLLATGYGVVWWGYGGFGVLPLHVNIMQATGLIMMALYAYLFFGPYRGFRRAFDSGDLAGAGRDQGRIRRIVATNLILGLFTAAVGATGPLWG